jgi:hypothetical protein
MTYTAALQQDQERIEAQYAVVEEIYIEGIGDAADGRFPRMAELPYLQGFAQGMRDFPRREVKLPVINTETQEFPLLCGQCHYLNNGKCGIKGIIRNGNQYACPSISVDCPF